MHKEKEHKHVEKTASEANHAEDATDLGLNLREEDRGKEFDIMLIIYNYL